MPEKDFRFGISSDIRGIDLNKLLISHPISTFLMRVADDIPEVGLFTGDVVIVDRSLIPKTKDLVVFAEGGDQALKIAPFETQREGFELWGVVVHLIRKIRA